ncbi:DNA excision repair protein ERCC-6-like [Crotalus adamanteus]|uniref:DNA excision repair protein ERCC-6-like n=1 Tax=Crotalus adamanteus TaxID=8729 RepID=A0AAW1AWD0_CROAD
MAGLVGLNPAQIEEYRRYVSQAKQEARSGNLEASIQLFQQALEIHFSEKLTANIKKLEEALASLSVDQEDDDFVDVCQSGLMLYGEIHAKLFDHQREGVAFLYKLYREGRKGGILADDMGLGKTVQIIAFLSGMFDAELIRSVLLVLPTTLLNNWVKEFAKWTPGLRVKVFHGTSKAERNRYLERIQRRNGVLLTTYQMVLNNWQQLSSFDGKEFVWDYIILDEAHKIKTPSAKTTKSVHAIPSKNRILLTGTPVQNNLKELWALFDFACQGSLLGTIKTFRMEYENPITKAREKDATPGEKALGLKISENLMSIIKPYFLRRTKNELQKKKKTELPNHLPEDQSKGVAPAMPSLPRKNEFIINFNLTLEDSENRPQAISEKDMSLEETEDEGFQLRLDSYCSSATESVGGEHGHPRNPETCNAVDGSVVMDDANSPCDSRDSFGWRKKKPTAIIVSDEEDENDELIDDLDEAKAGGICMSTPKTNRSTAAVCFSPRIKLSGRRSTASRRSLFDVVLEEVEGAPREAGTASNVSNDRSVQHEFEEELTQNYTEQTSEELEEEPSGETLDSESESSHLHDTDTSRGESSL